MKLTENNNYAHYLRSQVIEFFSQTANYIYIGLVLLALGLIWYSEGLWTTFKVFTVMTNGLTVTFVLTEGLMTLMYKEFKRNKCVTYFVTIGTLTTIILFLFDNKALYWSFATGLIFLVPVIVGLIVTKIKLGGR